MNELQETRRAFKIVTRVVIEKQRVIHAKYDKEHAVYLASIGRTDDQEKTVTVDVPVEKKERAAYLEYKIICAHCEAESWMLKANAQYCSRRCRSAALIQRKKAKQKP